MKCVVYLLFDVLCHGEFCWSFSSIGDNGYFDIFAMRNSLIALILLN